MKLQIVKNIWNTIKERKLLPQLLICIGLVGFVWFVTFGNLGLYHFHKSLKLKAKLKQDIVELENKIEYLKKQKELLNNPSHLELVIRQELGYVKPGEVVYQKIDK